MCGIFGVTGAPDSTFSPDTIAHLTKRLMSLSESRGKEASGLTLLSGNSVRVLKRPIPASELAASPEFRELFSSVRAKSPGIESGGRGEMGATRSVSIMGHSRLVTNGSQSCHLNNQPVVSDGIVGIHNGIIVNDRELWSSILERSPQSQLDTEVLLALIRFELRRGTDLSGAIQSAYRRIKGQASVALMFEDFDCLFLGTNNGSLYLFLNRENRRYVFASERAILEELLRERRAGRSLGDGEIIHIDAGHGYLINLSTLDLTAVPLTPSTTSGTSDGMLLPVPIVERTIRDISPREEESPSPSSAVTSSEKVSPGFRISVAAVDPEFERVVAEAMKEISSLRRCSRCVLPETMPYIEFDAAGVCSYCHSYSPINPKGLDALREAIAPLQRRGEGPDCLMSLSGGRDSTFGLHFVVRELGLKPITYTYDWGMVTDLARRNISRISAALGVEHILVSADINKKRANIRMNLSAWLKRPHLGMIPLLMAGDKQFFYHGERLRRRLDAPFVVLCDNLLEKTNFKSGFCGIPPSKERSVYKMSLVNRAKMIGFYGGEFLGNPAYLNRSLLDTVAAYASYYVLPHHMLSLFNYIPWSEEEMTATIRREYEWELAPDTTTTWRIGDGTAAFYNYVYLIAAGFTENDTFRSNQIREGMMTREEALERIMRENLPRWESIQWYCSIVGIDWRSAIRRINEMPRRYQDIGRA